MSPFAIVTRGHFRYCSRTMEGFDRVVMISALILGVSQITRDATTKAHNTITMEFARDDRLRIHRRIRQENDSCKSNMYLWSWTDHYYLRAGAVRKRSSQELFTSVVGRRSVSIFIHVSCCVFAVGSISPMPLCAAAQLDVLTRFTCAPVDPIKHTDCSVVTFQSCLSRRTSMRMRCVQVKQASSTRIEVYIRHRMVVITALASLMITRR